MNLIVLLLMAAFVPAWLLLGTRAARDADARCEAGRLVGVAWVLCVPIGVLLWMKARRRPLLASDG